MGLGLFRRSLVLQQWIAKKCGMRVSLGPEDTGLVYRMPYDEVAPTHCYLNAPYDYCRGRTLELVREQVEDLPGSVAECGVFMGDFARLMNHCFPNRKLFLYDTFESFDKRDADFDVEADFVKGVSRDDLHATCKTDVLDPVSFIRGACPHPEKLVFRKGYFPETVTPDADEEFAFVSLDTDLYKPIYAGLEFFYPRLHDGGHLRA